MAHIALQATLSPAGSLAISIIRGAAAGFVGGLVGQLRGGSFRSGFVGSVAGGLAHGVGSAVSSTLVAAVFGGLAAEASGGSFSDGALSAAMVHLFNDEVKFFDGANGWVIKDHMDSGVPGVVTGYIQHKINNQWMENQRSYGSGSKERWQWWEPLPGENDALVTYAYLPASPLVLYGETGLVMAYGFPGAVNGALNFYNSPSWIGGIGALCSDIGLSRGNVGTAATILGTALGIENQSYNIYYGKRQ